VINWTLLIRLYYKNKIDCPEKEVKKSRKYVEHLYKKTMYAFINKNLPFIRS